MYGCSISLDKAASKLTINYTLSKTCSLLTLLMNYCMCMVMSAYPYTTKYVCIIMCMYLILKLI